MGIWTFSSIVLLLVIIFFSYSLFVILKQKRLSEIQKDFINNMTHEFKTPLSTIGLSTTVLKDPNIINQPDRLLNYATIIEKENERLKQHVERVLQVAQLEKKDIELKKEIVDIHNVLEETTKSISHNLLGKNGKINHNLNAVNYKLPADKLHISNIFMNLFDNAIKYCQTNPLIIINTYSTRNKLYIEIIDNGVGINSENKKRVFQKFYRVPTGNIHDVKGFGLGLSYVKTILLAHHGNITLESAPGEGCVFKIWLPI